jgi:hypothetical protein
MITTIISGGQTGADQAGVEVGVQLQLRTGGYAPNGWITKDGPNQKVLQERYKLREHKHGYKERTYDNVRVSDGTIRCAVDFWSPGEICTLNAIKKYNKPYFDVYLPNPASAEEFVIWVIRYQIKVLNVAGNCQKTKGFDIFSMTFNWLRNALQNLYKRVQ